jgi:asparagine synthase (glutamine-hydrolysing)
MEIIHSPKAFDGWIPDEILLAAEGAIFRRGWVFLDRFPQGFRRKRSLHSAHGPTLPIVSRPRRRRQGSLSLPIDLRKEHFKNPSAVDLVPDGPSIACSTRTAVRWDAAWANQADPSGRAVKGVHGNSLK